MTGPDASSTPPRKRAGAWIALALLPALSGCVAAVAVPLVAGGGLMYRDRHRVRAATPVTAPAAAAEADAAKTIDDTSAAPEVVLTTLKELPPPDGSPRAPGATLPPDDRWGRFFDYALEKAAAAGDAKGLRSALLVDNPELDAPTRRECQVALPAVVIDLDDQADAFDPARLTPAPAPVVGGLARLRAAGVVVLWISQLPAARATDVAQALRTAGLDPNGVDQLLLIRGKGDRKQLLRKDANEDVCIVAVAGDKRGDFDELFDYLRNPGAAAGLYPMMGDGWFLVPPLEATESRSEGEPPAP